MANSALSRENETKIVKITHSASSIALAADALIHTVAKSQKKCRAGISYSPPYFFTKTVN